MHLALRAGKITFTAGPFVLGPGAPALQVDGKKHPLRAGAGTRGRAVWRSARVELAHAFTHETQRRLRVTSTLRNTGPGPLTLNAVVLFATSRLGLGPQPEAVRILEQASYLGRVRTPRQMRTGSDQQTALDGTTGAFTSQMHTLFYNPAARQGLLLGFETVDRWLPNLAGRMFLSAGRMASGTDNVDAGRAGQATAGGAESAAPDKIPAFRRFTIDFDGGDLLVAPGETVALGDWVLELGADPLALLDAHGARIARRNRFAPPPGPLANWCSWYPYRLGVTEGLVLATARAARARRLDQLGLRFLQVDLGWEKDNIPSFFEENERFAQGLAWLSRELRQEHFDLGVWVGVLCIASTHPVAQEHPEWLLRGADGQPHNCYNWFWAPFCPIFALDVSHPGAQQWLRENFTGLAKKGVRYVKWDFAGVGTHPDLRGRHDPRLVNTRAREAVRTAFRIAQTALESQGEPALMMDCSGTDSAAAGIAGLSYANMDTGNTGLGWRHLREIYTAYACHLFKHHWALLQPSCLVVGLPGTLEEARLRATVTFMGAGHVDLGDDLTTLPEDRWAVLLATLPPNDTPARTVDLFEPIATGTLPYLALIKEQPPVPPRLSPDPEGACVWTLPVKADWDEWTLVAFFNWTEPPVEEGSKVNLARRYQVALTRLGLPAAARLWAYEFWSGQFLGVIPRAQLPASAYRHPGDFAHPIQASGPGWLDIGFHGPAVKLLVLRRPRPHPWPVGTSFHQSGGRELSGVRWDPRTRTLSGQLLRPEGETGFIMIAGLPDGAVHRHPVAATAARTAWSVRL
ncbi:MAG: alpha-galactosidase [Verrucomicrobiota bacterium]